MANNNKNNIQELLVFKKRKQFKKNGKELSFDTYFATVGDESISVKFVKNATDQLEKLGVEFPAKISLELGDFFCGKKVYTNRHGDEALEVSLVIKNITAWDVADIPEQTIDEIIALKKTANK